MNLPPDWPLLLVAGAATALAIDAGSNLDVAVPAGVVAVTAAGLLLATSLGQVAWRLPSSSPLEPPTTMSSLRAAFRSGRAGRMSIVVELDRLERRVLHPSLPTRSAAEDERIRRMSHAEFRAYLNGRLDAIEAGDQ